MIHDPTAHATALAALAAARRHIEAQRDALDEALSHPEPAACTCDFIEQAKRAAGGVFPPRVQLGHLPPAHFGRVADLFEVEPQLREHADGARYLVIEVDRHGLTFCAQTFAPEREASTSAPEPAVMVADDAEEGAAP